MSIRVLNKEFSIKAKDLILISYGVFLLGGVIIFDKYSIYFLIGGILLPIILYNSIKNFSNIVLLYLVFLPFIQHLSFYAIKAGQFYITPHMIIQLIVLLLVFGSFLYNYSINKTKLNNLDKFMIIFVVATIFSLIYPYYLPVNHTKRWLLFYTGIVENVTFYFVILYLLKTERDFTKKIIIAIILSSLSALLVAFIEIREVGFNLINIFLARMRIGFGFHNSNLFGLYSAILFPLYFYVLTNKKYSNMKSIAWISFIVISVLSVLCFNRGTFLVLIVELFLLYRLKENRKIIYLFALAFIIGAVYFHELILLYVQRFLAGKNEAAATSAYIDLSALYRIEAWKLGVYLLVLFPVGLGAGGFQYAWEKFGPYSKVYLGTPHQLFLSVGVDYGILSMMIFIIILGASYYYCSLLSKSQIQYSRIFKYFKISLIGYICYGVTTGGELSHLTAFITPNNGYSLVLFSLLAIISFHYNKMRKSDND